MDRRPRLTSSGSRRRKPAVTLGTKDFTEEFILGELYKQALEAKGYTVNLKQNIGSTELIDTALTSGKIDVYPEYTGAILAVTFHQNDAAEDRGGDVRARQGVLREARASRSSTRRRSTTPTRWAC